MTALKTIVEGSLYFKGDVVFKLIGETKTNYLGYDIFTETFIEVSKAICQPLPAFALQLLGSELNRVKLAVAIKGLEDATSILDLSRRTVYRKVELIEKGEVCA
jgi:hypothetical protein